jgi:hypothetical protein
MTIEEKREKDRLRMSKWLKNNPAKREKNRLKNNEWRKNNREKYNQSMNDWRANNPDKVVRYKLKKRYGLTPEQYTQMSFDQNGCCSICGQPESAINVGTNKVQKLAVDHCHKTGKVRALLCMDCNRGLGKFKDDPKRLQGAIDYLLAFS